jgi:hypothetical protein
VSRKSKPVLAEKRAPVEELVILFWTAFLLKLEVAPKLAHVR